MSSIYTHIASVLATSQRLVSRDRAETHGDVAENLEQTANLWSVYLCAPITAHDVAQMMVLLKISRSKSGSYNPDDYVDGAAYSAIAGALASEAGRKHRVFDEPIAPPHIKNGADQWAS